MEGRIHDAKNHNSPVTAERVPQPSLYSSKFRNLLQILQQVCCYISTKTITGDDAVAYPEDDARHERRVRLLAGEELADDLVHDVLRREEGEQEVRQNARDQTRLARTAHAHPVNNQ